MDPQTRKLDGGAIRYDADLFLQAATTPAAKWFRPAWWEAQGRVESRQRGRGTAITVETAVGRSVLRQYLRGGWAARFIRSRYVFTGYHRSRPFREFEVLVRLARLDLPAPRPVAGLCERHGLACTGALLTLEIEHCRQLEHCLKVMDAEAWRRVGRCIRKFHDHGLVHADLTVRNILIQEGGAVYLVDFDRARFRQLASRAFARNLERLQRSLRKSWLENDIDTDESAWMQLMKGYEP